MWAGQGSGCGAGCAFFSIFRLEGWADLTRPLNGDRYVPDVDDAPDSALDL